MHTNIRKWGNSAGTIIPAPVLAEAGFTLGDTVDIEAVDGTIIIKPAAPSFTLESLLATSSEQALALDAEDEAWLHDDAVGQEL